MKLLKIENNNLCSITPEALGLKVFRDLWERDKTAKKEKARLDLSFVYFYSDWSSPYKKMDKEIKIEKLEKEVYGLEQKADEKVIAACELYEKLQNESSFSLKFLDSAEEAANRAAIYLKTINLAERTKLGGQVYNVAQVNKAISDMPNIVKKIQEMRRAVETELSQDANIRGGAKKGMFEDPDNNEQEEFI